jgi:hypothetical protein
MATLPQSRRLNLTREQLATFLGDQQQIRQFELLFAIVDTISGESVSAGKVYAGPVSGPASPPVFRPLVQSDFPSEPLTKTDDTNVKITLGGDPANALLAATSINASWSGQLSVARGGTGQSVFSNGEILIGNSSGNTLTKSTLTPGANITITNNPGSIEIAVSGLGTMAFQNIGASGSFTTVDSKTVTVVDGIITSIV